MHLVIDLCNRRAFVEKGSTLRYNSSTTECTTCSDRVACRCRQQRQTARQTDRETDARNDWLIVALSNNIVLGIANVFSRTAVFLAYKAPIRT